MSELCKVLEVSSSGYYKWLRLGGSSQHSREDEQLSYEVRCVFQDSLGRYGSPRIYQLLRRTGRRCSRRRVARLMRQSGLTARRRTRRVRTTDSGHGSPVAANLLNRRFSVAEIEGPNRCWCSDFTYIATDQGWLFLAVVIDLFSRRVVGWSMSDTMEVDFVLDAFTMAVVQRKPEAGLLHHSDRGSQYAAQVHRQLLDGESVTTSMSRKGNCWDNAVVESFFATLKTELIGRRKFATRAAARRAIFEYIEGFYNRQRLHSTLGYMSPAEYEGSRQPQGSGAKATSTAVAARRRRLHADKGTEPSSAHGPTGHASRDAWHQADPRHDHVVSS